MRTLLWLLALFALAVGVSLAFGLNEGYVLVVLPPWRIELSLNLFIVLAGTGILVGYIVLRLIGHTLRLPQAVRAFRERKRRAQSARALRQAVLQLFAGRYGHALKNAVLAHDAGEAPGLCALIAARAAHQLRDERGVEAWLRRAAEDDAEAQNARLMTAAELHVDGHRFEAALAALDTLQQRGGRHIAALRLALRAYRGLGRWDDVLQAVRRLEKHRALEREAATPLKLGAHLENLRTREGDAKALLGYWNGIPDEERRMPRLAAAAARALIAAGASEQAQRIIEEQADREWDTELALLYAACRGGDTLARIARAEKWLELHPGDARLLLALGRLCCEQKLWGKAQSYLEAALALWPNQEVYAELAALFDRLGRTEEANRAYRSAAAHCVKPSLSA
jgi:HemY protein